jgi:hypothetical protein
MTMDVILYLTIAALIVTVIVLNRKIETLRKALIDHARTHDTINAILKELSED